MDEYQKDDFGEVQDDDGRRFLKLIKGGETKNHKADDQAVMEKGGKIPFEENALGFSPAQFILEYKKKLNPETNFLCQRPRRKNNQKNGWNLNSNPDIW